MSTGTVKYSTGIYLYIPQGSAVLRYIGARAYEHTRARYLEECLGKTAQETGERSVAMKGDRAR